MKIEKPDDTNFILGQTHFIKTVADIHEALVAAVLGIKNSGLLAPVLIEVGSDHRLDDPEPLAAMFTACEEATGR